MTTRRWNDIAIAALVVMAVVAGAISVFALLSAESEDSPKQLLRTTPTPTPTGLGPREFVDWPADIAVVSLNSPTPNLNSPTPTPFVAHAEPPIWRWERVVRRAA